MVGAPTTLQSPSAASQKCPRSRLASIAFPVRRNAAAAAEPPQKQARVSIDSQVELYTQNLDGPSLLKWLDIIALGLETKSCTAASRAASSTSGAERSVHVPAIRNAAKLHFSAEFVGKHPRIVRQCRAVCKRRGSQWKEESADVAGVVKITNLRSFQDFLKQMRRLRSVAGVSTSYLPKEPAASQAAKSLGAGRKSLWPLRRA